MFTTWPVGPFRRCKQTIFEKLLMSFCCCCCCCRVVAIYWRRHTEGEFGVVPKRLRELRTQIAGPVPSQRSIRAQESLHGKLVCGNHFWSLLNSFYDWLSARMNHSFSTDVLIFIYFFIFYIFAPPPLSGWFGCCHSSESIDCLLGGRLHLRPGWNGKDIHSFLCDNNK